MAVRERRPMKAESVKRTSLLCLTLVKYREDPRKPSCVSNRLPADGSEGGTTVGYPYPEVLAMVRDAHPDVETSIDCLVWYCVQVRAGTATFEGIELPRRRERGRR